MAERPTSSSAIWLFGFRMAGGLLGVCLPLVASYTAGPTAYGVAAAAQSVLIIFFGPVNFVLTSSLLRELRKEQNVTRARDGLLAAVLLQFALLVPATAVADATSTFVYAGLLALGISLISLKVCEAALLALSRPWRAIAAVYVLPPLLSMGCVAVIGSKGASDGGASAIIVCLTIGNLVGAATAAPRIGSLVTRLRAAGGRVSVRRGASVVLTGAFNGGVIALAAELPMQLLSATGLQAHIYKFEVARKVASIINNFAQAASAQNGPRIMTLLHQGDVKGYWSLVRPMVVEATLITVILSFLISAAIVGGAHLFAPSVIGEMQENLPVTACFLLGAGITAVTGPFQLGLVALSREKFLTAALLVGVLANILWMLFERDATPLSVAVGWLIYAACASIAIIVVMIFALGPKCRGRIDYGAQSG